MLRTVGKTIFLGGIAGLLLVGCLNQVGPRKTNSKSPIQFPIAPEGVLPPAVVVQKLVRTQTDPQFSVDLIGEAAFTQTAASEGTTRRPSGELGSFCAGPPNNPACGCLIRATVTEPCPPSSDPATCTPRETTRAVTFAPVYYEADLVRCPVPNDWNTNELEISIVKSGRSGASNPTSFTLTPPLSLNDPLFYSEVHRYACRWSQFVGHLTHATVIDTIQSDSPESTVSRTFYTTNMGRALAKFSDLDWESQAYYECPPHLNPADTSLALGISTSTGTITISDNAGTPSSDDSVNFLLAKSPAGPFQVAVYGEPAPNVAGEVLGYAARSVSGACPSPQEADIPGNLEWRKLWVYHGVPTGRGYYSSAGSQLQSFTMFCDPGGFKVPKPIVQIPLLRDPFLANNYHLIQSCGQAGTAALGFWDTGVACTSSAGRPEKRVLHGSDGIPRCIFMTESGGKWFDSCSDSERPQSTPLQDQFNDLQWIPHAVPREFIFVTTNASGPDPLKNMALVRPRQNPDDISDTYTRLDKHQGTDFPLCVLRKRAGSP